MSGLRFNDDVYTVTITETPAIDSNTSPSPPAPVSGIVLRTMCIQNNGTPVNSNDLRFQLQQNNTASHDLFSINVSTGEFSVADFPFDYEAQPWYLVNLFCYLQSDNLNNGTGVVYVSIAPVNEYFPEINANQNTYIVLEETVTIGIKLIAVDPTPGALRTYTATDRDAGIDGVIEYTLSSDQEDIEQFFDLNKNSGTLTLKQSLDIDELETDKTFARLKFTITACNKNIPFERCEKLRYLVFIIGVNDNAPIFDQLQYGASINESAPNGTPVVQTTCIDKDVGIGGVESITYYENTSETILTTFGVNSTGTVLLQSELDYESTTNYHFMLKCSDGGKIEATTQVTVTILPVNDNSPYFDIKHYEFTVDRTDASPSDTIIGTVRASDDDKGGVGANIRYSIVSSSYFNINENTGEITLKGYLHTCDGGIFEFDVMASDGEHQATTHVRVVTKGLPSVADRIYVGIAGVILLVIVGIIVLYL